MLCVCVLSSDGADNKDVDEVDIVAGSEQQKIVELASEHQMMLARSKIKADRQGRCQNPLEASTSEACQPRINESSIFFFFFLFSSIFSSFPFSRSPVP
jgi:hypothetical protein